MKNKELMNKAISLFFNHQLLLLLKRICLQVKTCLLVNAKHDVHVLHCLTNGALEKIVNH